MVARQVAIGKFDALKDLVLESACMRQQSSVFQVTMKSRVRFKIDCRCDYTDSLFVFTVLNFPMQQHLIDQHHSKLKLNSRLTVRGTSPLPVVRGLLRGKGAGTESMGAGGIPQTARRRSRICSRRA